MVSEADQGMRVGSEPCQDAIPSESTRPLSLAYAWISAGGVAVNCMKYAPPSYAVAWGHMGCPLLPRDIRQSHTGVRLPDYLEEVLGLPLTADQLDAGALERLEMDTIEPASREFRDFLYSMPILAAEVAIPAGIPLAWIEDLPITTRTRNAVRRAFRRAAVDGFLKAPMLARQFLSIYSVGVMALNELTCVIESAELGWADEDQAVNLDDTAFQQEAVQVEHPIDSSTYRSIEGMSSFNKHVYEFAKWALAETDAQTFGEAIAEATRTKAGDQAWNPVALLSLSKLAAHPPHPYQVLDKWIEQLDDRSQTIFMRRVSCDTHDVVTLEELGARFSVTRERIRQVEAKVRRALEGFLASDEALPLRWRTSTLRRTLGVAAPLHTVEHLLTSPPGCNDYRKLLLEMAGPYDRRLDWLILRSARSDDPTSAILTRVDDVGRIDKEFAASRLTEWGLGVSLHERWLTGDGSVRLFNGQLVRWGASASDRLAFALADMGRPATVDEMVTHVAENRSRNSIKNALAADSRTVRVSRTHWALASWNLAEYSGIAESMRSLIEEHRGAMAIDALVHRMHQTVGVPESSTIAYCGAPMFVVEGKSIHLRTKHDGPFRYDQDFMRRTPGVFDLGPMRVGRLLKVDKDLLRGSGTTLTHPAGSILGLEVEDHLSFGNRHGDKVDIAFPETSHTGPHIGSVRRFAERLAAKEGDCLTLVLDRTDMTVTAFLTDLRGQSPGWDVIGRLTGIAAPINADSLADALRCKREELRSVLRERGDDVVLNFLPKPEFSSRFDDALSALEDHIERGRGHLP